VPRPQLNLRLDPVLHRRLAAAALADGTTVSDLCRGWILEGLERREGSSCNLSTSNLSERMAALEARLAALEAGRRHRPLEASQINRSGDAPASGDDLPVPGGAIVTADLARRLGISSEALNRLARDKGVGATHRSGWRVAGKAHARSGLDRWLWSPPEPAEATNAPGV